jgi:hypothetical protein
MALQGFKYAYFALLVFLWATAGCAIYTPNPAPSPKVLKTVPASLQVPINIERLAILYPKTYNRDLLNAYARLHGASFQLKELRPLLRIVERFDLPTILDEHRFQLGGGVSDESAIRLGRLLGVDTVLIYRIEGPSSRDLLFAQYSGSLPSYLVSSKVIRVESAEVVFHNVVTSMVEGPESSTAFFSSGHRWNQLARAALDRGIEQTIADLWNAFQ